MLLPSLFTRRRLILNSSAALVAVHAEAAERNPFAAVAGRPDSVLAFTETGEIPLKREGSTWNGENGVQVGTDAGVTVRCPRGALLRIRLRWQLTPGAALRYAGDHWERSYGDLAWRYMEPERILPWYFLATDGKATHACGVKTAPAAFCFWQVDPSGVSLWLDVRNGGRGVQLGKRELAVATVVTETYNGVSSFGAAGLFCKRLCVKPRLPRAPVYGGNNWYYAYGKSSAEDIRRDSERIAALAPGLANRPFMVIDDGWEPNHVAGPWSRGNAGFPDMPQLAQEMRRIGVQPGIWMRPLFLKDEAAKAWRLQSPNAAREYAKGQVSTLDPTIPEVQERVQQDIRTLAGWGYGLIKHDFSTYDLLGRWGFNMGAQITDDNWSFADRSRTNAEIIRQFYSALRQAAGETLLLGCNTVGHLAAGLFELQRTGDDTSGRDWNRTRKMGVNTLAFRAPQHNAFFALDADCVGITRQIPWALNRQWLDLLARSGTALFVSAAPDAVGRDQQDAIRQAFRMAAAPGKTGEPLDWLDNSEPQRWNLSGRKVSYEWFGREGVSPFAG
jgi:alpha-galactosidase